MPLDPEYPLARRQFLLKDSGVSVVITGAALPQEMNLAGITVLDLMADAPLLELCSCQNPANINMAEHLAYVIYTSGSTGQPKGVCVPHQGVVRLVRSQDYAEFNDRQRVLLLSSTSFDAATFELWGPLLNGGTCVVFPNQPLDFQQLEDAIRRHKITCLWLTAGLFNQIVDLRPSVLETVGHVLTGGDTLSVSHVQKAIELLPNIRLTNGYGPTESTTFACCYAIKKGEVFPNGSVPIGRPIINTRCYLLDERLEPVPVGVPAELYLGGDGLARGYWKRPELTAEKFIANPFGSEPGERLYKTGDLARYLPDGNIEFLGRLDNQVKIRGFRVEMGEIEAILSTHPQVLSATVIAREDIPDNKHLVAYLVAREHTAPTTTELREFLLKQMPDYMVPSAFVMLERLPLTPHGKVDRKALPAPDANRLESGTQFVAPQTQIEMALAKIWRELLGIERIGIHENFFVLGGHSLTAVRMFFRIRELLNIELPALTISQFPTIAELGQVVGDAGKIASADFRPGPLRRPRTGVSPSGRYPASFNQQQLWFIDQLASGRSVYNLPFMLRLRGRLDREALRRSLNHLVGRHEVLRTRFVGVNGVPMQVVAPELAIELPLEDLQTFSEAEREAGTQRLMLEEAGRSFDLSQLPLVRARLLCLGNENHVLLVTVHHIVFDGWSVDVLLRELAAGYAAFHAGRTPNLPELPIQYADYAVWQRAHLTKERVEEHLKYWREKLAGVPMMLELPADRPPAAIQHNQGAEQRFKLSTETTRKLHALAQQQEGTLFMVFLAAFQVLLHRYSRQEQILVGVPFAGRTSSDVEGLIGFFVNALPVKGDFAGNPRFEDFLRQVRDAIWEVQRHQELPFEEIVREVQPTRKANRNSIFQVCAVHELLPPEPGFQPELSVEFKELTPQEAMFDLTFAVTERRDRLDFAIRYNTSLFDAATVTRLIESFQSLCEGVVANPRQTVTDIPLLTNAQRHRLLTDWNATSAPYPQDKCIHELFEAQVAKTPEAIAVVFERKQLTYHELNERANQLAHHLQKLGVGPEKLVGLFLERSLDLVVGLLGILKAGGAYVPMDPKYPRERLAFIMEDAQPLAVLTQQSLLAQLSAGPVQVVCLDSAGESNPAGIDVNHAKAKRPRANNLGYVIYTSGSTGKPKGVAIEHRSAVNFIHWGLEEFSDLEMSGVLAATSVCFDLSIFELFVTLGRGGKVIIAENLLQLPSLDAKAEVTLINTVPSVIAELMKDSSLPTGVQVVNLAGEPLSALLVDRIYALRSVNEGQ